jgi:hypothetical protein
LNLSFLVCFQVVSNSEDQNQLNNQPNMENPTNDVDFLVDHEGHQETLMEEMTL